MIQAYRSLRFQKKNLILLEKIKEILKEYDHKDIRVTLRQLYYQLVSRDIIPNQVKEYQKLSALLTSARYNGDIDWEVIEDRVRIPDIPNTFKDIKELLDVATQSYQLDRWDDQECYVELWTEKDALSSVIVPITKKYQVTFCVNRGYTSASSMYESAQRLLSKKFKKIIILYLGDFDASGLDMDRDIKVRLSEFNVINLEVIRIGLTKTQIDQYNPPPNPAKQTDPRAKWFRETHGDTSWEVDSLRPEILQTLIEDSILTYLDVEKYELVKKKEEEDKLELK
jgi:hypothetical protein